MRPVDKGEKPDTYYSEYGDVKEELIKRIGAFCSFCELPIRHVPEVEHREAQSRKIVLIGKTGSCAELCKG